MAIKEQVQVLLDKKMDRQEFLKHVAIALVAMTGIGTLLRSLTQKSNGSTASGGYGSSAYGGSDQSNKLG